MRLAMKSLGFHGQTLSDPVSGHMNGLFLWPAEAYCVLNLAMGRCHAKLKVKYRILNPMEKILELCEWCSDVFGTTLLILLILIFLPAIIAVAMLLFIVAVPIGIVLE